MGHQHDAPWIYKAFDCLFGFCYLHVVTASHKPEKDREHSWDWNIGRYYGVSYKSFGSVNLLAGYVLETLIKGCLDQAGMTPKEYRGHDLRRLAEALAAKWSLTLTAGQLEFLEHMKGVVVWRGRYPMSKNPQEVVTTGLSLGGQLLADVGGIWNLFFDELARRDPFFASFTVEIDFDTNADWVRELSTFDKVHEVAKLRVKEVGAAVETREHGPNRDEYSKRLRGTWLPSEERNDRDVR